MKYFILAEHSNFQVCYVDISKVTSTKCNRFGESDLKGWHFCGKTSHVFHWSTIYFQVWFTSPNLKSIKGEGCVFLFFHTLLIMLLSHCFAQILNPLGSILLNIMMSTLLVLSLSSKHQYWSCPVVWSPRLFSKFNRLSSKLHKPPKSWSGVQEPPEILGGSWL